MVLAGLGSTSIRITLTDPVNNTTTWVYDNLNRVIEETNELTDTRYFEYDAASNLTKKGREKWDILLFDDQFPWKYPLE